MTNILSDAVNKKGMPIEIAALYISSGYQATSGIIKIAAPFKYISKTFEYAIVGKTSQKQGKKFREEHNPPASVIGANLILAIKNNQVKDVFPFIEKNYYQTKLSKADDAKLDMAKLDSVLPEGTSIFDNPIKRLAAAGINLNSIENPFTSKNIAEENGYGVPKEFENMPDVIADQNSTVLSNKEIDKKVLNKNLNFSKSRDVSRVQNINDIKMNKSKEYNHYNHIFKHHHSKLKHNKNKNKNDNNTYESISKQTEFKMLDLSYVHLYLYIYNTIN